MFTPAYWTPVKYSTEFIMVQCLEYYVIKKYCIIRLLMDAYVTQEATVILNSCQFTYFRLKNGVKHGGVLCPTLYNLYIDR